MSLVLKALTPQTRRQAQLELEQIGVFQRQPRPSVQLTGAVEPQRGPMGKARGTADHQSTHGNPPHSVSRSRSRVQHFGITGKRLVN